VAAVIRTASIPNSLTASDPEIMKRQIGHIRAAGQRE